MKIGHACGLVAYLPVGFSGDIVIECPSCGRDFEIESSRAVPSDGQGEKYCPECKAVHDGDVTFCFECGYHYKTSSKSELKVIHVLHMPPTPLQEQLRKSVRRKGDDGFWGERSVFQVIRVVVVLILAIAAYVTSGPAIDRFWLDHYGVRNTEEATRLVDAYRYAVMQEFLCERIGAKYPRFAGPAIAAREELRMTWGGAMDRIDRALAKASPHGEWPQIRKQLQEMGLAIVDQEVLPLLKEEEVGQAIENVRQQADWKGGDRKKLALLKRYE